MLPTATEETSNLSRDVVRRASQGDVTKEKKKEEEKQIILIKS